jgi:hypothetical protein
MAGWAVRHTTMVTDGQAAGPGCAGLRRPTGGSSPQVARERAGSAGCTPGPTGCVMQLPHSVVGIRLN